MGRPSSRGEREPGLFPELAEPAPVVPTAPARALFVDVALNRPVQREFTYGVPDELAARARPGARVAVPFARRREVGVVVGLRESTPLGSERVRDVARFLDEEPVLDGSLLELTRWMAREYACSWGEALAAVLPASLKREGEARRLRLLRARPGVGAEELALLEEPFPKQHRLLRTLLEIGGAIELTEVLRRAGLSESPARTLVRKGLARFEWADPTDDPACAADVARPRPAELALGQRWAVKTLAERIDAREHGAFLLQGVTGSGKTEVYLRAIEHALAAGRGAIVLVPEIALTPQTVGWFRSRFGSVAVLHSRMTDAVRMRTWLAVQRGEARVVVGARSAVFAPVRDLGVVVVDEEHEPSFKQGGTPRYHARDVALERARTAGAVCVLGSATPSLESWQAARDGRLRRLVLPERIGGAALPAVEVVDLRNEPRDKASRGLELFSRRLRELLVETWERGEQSILFLNRRGFAPVSWCRDCRTTVRCGRCSTSMSFHRRIGRLVCHLCCEELRPPSACPSCTSPRLALIGGGSERVEATLARLLPEARARRMDSDTMHRREDYEQTLAAFGRREIDVLVGTQMIAKGLDFPGVTLVGIVSADTALHLPDFRAAERTFQLIEQVAGRAGRGSAPGRIVVQTASPEHPAVALAAEHRYEDFAAAEAALRRELGYPPFGRLVRVLAEGDEAAAQRAGEEAARRLRDAARDAGAAVDVLGPAPAPLAVVRGRARRHVLAKCADEAALDCARTAARELSRAGRGLRVAVDVDPVSLL